MTRLSSSMLLDPSVLADPYDFYRTLREQAPVWSVPGTEVVTISTFDLLSEAVARPEDFSSTMRCLLYRDEDGLPARLDFGDAATPTLAAADPPLHTTHRRAVFPELVARRMRALEDDIRALSATTVASALRDNNFDFMATIGNIVPITVVATLIGFQDTDTMQLLQAAVESTTMVGGTMPLDRLNDLVTRIGVIQEWIADQVTAAREGDDETILLAVRRALDVGQLRGGVHQFRASHALERLHAAGFTHVGLQRRQPSVPVGRLEPRICHVEVLRPGVDASADEDSRQQERTTAVMRVTQQHGKADFWGAGKRADLDNRTQQIRVLRGRDRRNAA